MKKAILLATMGGLMIASANAGVTKFAAKSAFHLTKFAVKTGAKVVKVAGKVLY